MTLDSKIPSGPLAEKWDRHRFEMKLVNPANKRKYTILVVGSGLAGASAAASLGELGYNVLCFCIHDSPRRAHSIAAQGGINAAKNYQNDGDSIYRLFYDTIKGGDYRAREANVYRLAQNSVRIIDQCVAQGVPFAREYGGMLDNRSFGGAQVSRTFYARGQTGQQLLLGAYQALMRQVAAGTVRMLPRREMLDLVVVDGKARGIVTRNLITGELESWAGHAVCLCTGGYGTAYYLSTNAVQSNVIGAAHRAGVKRLIFFASSCMYPREAPQPMAESALFSGRPEETSMGYAVAKIAGTQLCLAYNQQSGGKRFVPVIPNSVYGPHDNFDPATGHVLAALIARFHNAKSSGAASVKLWGSGRPRREFLYADDLAEACWLLLNTDFSSVDLPLNIGPGTDTTVRELASTIADTVGYGGKVEWDASMPDGAPRKLLDSSRMKKLGWRAQVPLAEGVRRTYDWYRANA